jgi:hypothetical protein
MFCAAASPSHKLFQKKKRLKIRIWSIRIVIANLSGFSIFLNILYRESFVKSYSIRACFENKAFFITGSLQPFVEQIISGGKQKMLKKTVSMRLL